MKRRKWKQIFGISVYTFCHKCGRIIVEDCMHSSFDKVLIIKDAFQIKESRKPVPIRRKGCKNVGWVWDRRRERKLVVPLHPGKPTVYVSDGLEMKNVLFDKKGVLAKTI